MSRMFVLTLLALMAVGCGTVVNLVTPTRGDKTYGGIRKDMDTFAALIDAKSSDGPLSTSGGGEAALFALAIAVFPILDLPFSFVGDTLAYPLTRWLDGE